MTNAELAVELLQATLRWTHVASAMVWIGAAFAFSALRRAVERAPDPAARRAHALVGYPGVLGWLRWGAAATWMLGFVLLFLLYYRAPLLLDTAALDPLELEREVLADGKPAPRAWIPGFLALIAAFPAYELCVRFLRRGLANALGLALWGAAVISAGCLLETSARFSARATFVHIATFLATAMAANVWMRIWPAERRALLALAAGEQPDAAEQELSRARQRHNAAMALSVVLLMLSSHSPVLFGGVPWPWQWVAGAILVLGVALAELLTLASRCFSVE